MNLRGDELGRIIDLIAESTRFHRHYLGEVLDDADELSRGRVRVSVPELGWFTMAEATWAEPEYGIEGHATPAVGSWVTVYFMAGNPSRAVYRGRPGEVKGTTPASYLTPDDVVLVDDGVIVKYNRGIKALSITGAELVSVNGSSKSLVTHAELNAALQAMILALNLALGTKLDGAGAPGAISVDISGAATSVLKVGS